MPAAHDTYTDQLRELQRGQPLYYPEPSPEGPVEIGDVGYITEGAFYRLFNAARPANDPTQTIGVPKGFEPLHMGRIRSFDAALEPGPLHSKAISRVNAEVGSSGSVPLAETPFQFSCTSSRGAILMLETQMMRQKALQLGLFEEYLLKHSKSWYSFARDQHVQVEFGDIMLVTECSKTAAWTSVVYSQSPKKFGMSFSAGLGFLPLAGDGQEKITPMEHRRSPRRATTLEKIEGNAYNQTVFLKAYRLGHRDLYSRSYICQLMRQKNRLQRPDDQDDHKIFGIQNNLTNVFESTRLNNGYVDSAGTLISPKRPDFHPSVALLAHLMETTNLEVAVVHDDAWCFPSNEETTHIINDYARHFFSDDSFDTEEQEPKFDDTSKPLMITNNQQAITSSYEMFKFALSRNRDIHTKGPHKIPPKPQTPSLNLPLSHIPRTPRSNSPPSYSIRKTRSSEWGDKGHLELEETQTLSPARSPEPDHNWFAPIVAELTPIFSNKARYKHYLARRGQQAQRLLDLLQMLMDIPGLQDTFRSDVVVAMQRLSRGSGLYPASFDLKDTIQLEGSGPVMAGSFADIYKGHFRNQPVCLKVIRVYQTSRVNNIMKHIFGEALLWGQLSHPNLLPFYGIYQHNDRMVCLVSPWMNNGDVNQFLQHNPDADRARLALDAAMGISYLHNRNIIHGDVKGSNTLVSPSGVACLADFGLSGVLNSQILTWSSQSSWGSTGGSLRWQAPELLNPELWENGGQAHNTKASDVYAWSCLCYEIFTGHVPFFEFAANIKVTFSITQGKIPSRPPPASISWSQWQLTDSIWQLMNECWSYDPTKRPGIDAIVTALDRRAGITHRAAHWEEYIPPHHFRRAVNEPYQYPSVEDFKDILSG